MEAGADFQQAGDPATEGDFAASWFGYAAEDL